MHEAEINKTTKSGFTGLWASGDMTWEFGGRVDVDKLIEWELLLEDLMARQESLSGVCQYHADTLPFEALKAGLKHHKNTYVNDTLSRVNKLYRSAS